MVALRLILLLVSSLCLASRSVSVAGELSALAEARALVEATTGDERDELLQEFAIALARREGFTEAETIGRQLTPARQGMVLLEVAARLPDSRRKDAEQLTLDAQTAKSLTKDWRRARLARLVAAQHARLDHFEVAESLAQGVPDTEERAFALLDVVAAFCRAGRIDDARRLAGTIEENRRYGTYRQKAAALALTAQSLHARGNPDDAATLLAQADLLLPKKPGWSDGSAIVAVGLAAHVCGQPEKSQQLLSLAEASVKMIAGPWKVSELTRIAAAWRSNGESKRAAALLADAIAFSATLSPLERADEGLILARALSGAGEVEKARAMLRSTWEEAGRPENATTWRKARVRTLLLWLELFGDELPEKK